MNWLKAAIGIFTSLILAYANFRIVHILFGWFIQQPFGDAYKASIMAIALGATIVEILGLWAAISKWFKGF
jgi:hypothetical protein